MADQSFRRMSRRQLLQIGTMSAAGALLAACSGASQPAKPAESKPAESKPAESKPAAPAAQPAATTAAQPTTAPPAAAAGQAAPPVSKAQSGKTIKVAVLNNFKGEALDKSLPNFEAATGIKVQFDKLPLENLVDKLTVSFAGGSSDYDAAMMDEPWVAGLTPYLQPLDDMIAKDKMELKVFVGPAAAGVINKVTVALPLDPNVQMVWYRKDLFDAKGVKPPTNLDELIAAAEKLHDPANDVSGISIAAKKEAQTMVAAITLLWKEGGEVITPDGKWGFDSPAGLKAFETYQRILKVAPQGSLAYGGPEQLDAFYQGKVASILYWASAGPNAIDPAKSKVADKVGWTSIPNAMRGVWVLGMPKSSKNQEAAWEYLKWMTGPKGGLDFTNFGGGHSAAVDVLKAPDFVKKYPWAPDLQKALETCKARPQTPHWTAIQTAIVDMSTAILSGQQSAEQAIKAAGEQLSTYLKA
jgi:multiple sugar transport system substrate-binding protein